MAIFETIQKQYAILGISPSNQSIQPNPFSERVLFGFVLFACDFVLKIMYIFNVASGFMEYLQSICTTSGTVITLVSFAVIVFRKSKVFESIENFRKLIYTSECLF